MVAVADRPVPASSDPSSSARGRRAAPRPLDAPHALWWRWLPWAAPRLRLGPEARPRTRLELALCALFRCRREWPARELVERLALAPVGSDDTLALVGRRGPAPLRALGRGAAWDAVRDWLERGMVTEVESIDTAPARGLAPAVGGTVGQAETRSWPARSPG